MVLIQNFLNCFFFLNVLIGTPTKPTIKVSNANGPFFECDERPVILSCSSWSTTAPSGHNLQMLYTWLQNEEVITPGGRFELDVITSNTLTISEVYINDTAYPFRCVATEQGANLSHSSNGYSLQVNCKYTHVFSFIIFRQQIQV